MDAMTRALLVILSASAVFGQTLQIASVPNPAAQGSIQPNWAVAADGSILLSWVEPQKDDTYSMKFAMRKDGKWSPARTIVANRSFFRHPAEIPSMVGLADGTLVAEWIENGKDGESEFVNVSTSKDGVKWSAPQIAHKNRAEAQHGLASMIASGPNEVSILWLQALMGEDNPAALMRTVVGADGKEIREEQLDADVCTCCPTSVVKTNKGLLVAYRDHTTGDIRDIAVTRFENGKWTQTKNVYPDKWKIDACPTNAATAAAQGDRVAIGWYTGADDKPKVQLVFSTDGGATFTKPVSLSTGRAFGYVSTILDKDGGALVSWIEQGTSTAQVLVRSVSAAGVAGPVTKVAEGTRQSLGYPRLLNTGSEIWIAWGDNKTSFKTAQIKR